jgi:hypothetical protein
MPVFDLIIADPNDISRPALVYHMLIHIGGDYAEDYKRISEEADIVQGLYDVRKFVTLGNILYKMGVL